MVLISNFIKKTFMNTERIEQLLEQLIDKQDNIIDRLDALETTMGDQVQAVRDRLGDIFHELVWWGEEHTLAKQLLESLGRIETAVERIPP